MPRRASLKSAPSFRTPLIQRTDSSKIPFFQRRSTFAPTSHSAPSSLPFSPLHLDKYQANVLSNTVPTMTSQRDASNLDLNQLVESFKRNVPIKDRRWRLQIYKKCFVGSEAVQWMVTSGITRTREDAVKLGLLMQEKGFIEHCVRDHEYVQFSQVDYRPLRKLNYARLPSKLQDA